MKWLIVTADDFGMSRGINLGIVRAHRGGILTSASLLVNRPASEEAAALGRECPTLSLGLHLELDPTHPARVPAELEHQVASFQQLVGEIVFMTVLGGFRSFAGPVIGAIVFNYLKTYAVGYTVYWQLLLGAVLVALVLSLPTGIAASARKLLARFRRSRP